MATVDSGLRPVTEAQYDLADVPRADYVVQVKTDGISTRTVRRRLHRNAVVRDLRYVVTASRADAAALPEVAQVRQAPQESGVIGVAADFGSPRTITAVGIQNDATDLHIWEVLIWDGIQFKKPPLYSATPSPEFDPTRVTATPPATPKTAVFSEVRSERLLIRLLGPVAPLAEIADKMWVRLPDTPADLELRLNQEAPIWLARGAAQPGVGGWSDTGSQVVDLTTPLAPLTGDPDREEQIEVELHLSARVPGLLELEEDRATTHIRYATRPVGGANDSLSLSFSEEGERIVSVPLRGWVRDIEEIHLSVRGEPGSERITPPKGPPVAGSLNGSRPLGGSSRRAVADLRLVPARSACVQLPRARGLGELGGVRLPLRAGEDGAEIQVRLLESTTGGAEPGQPRASGHTDPVVLEASPDFQWTTFRFPAPVPTAELTGLWAALVVARGVVHWPLGAFSLGTVANAVRPPPPTGPWRALPALVANAAHLGGRIRLMGTESDEEPLPPLLFRPGRASPPSAVAIRPHNEGAEASWRASVPFPPRLEGGQKLLDLRFLSFCPATYTVESLTVIASR